MNGAKASPESSPPTRPHSRTTSPLIDRLGLYPGSPAISAALLREKDRLIACELHPEDAATLKREFSGTPGVAIHERDGYEALRAFLPPPEKRALILIDPPFERPDEFATLAKSLIAAYEKFKTGVYVVWYPIKHRAPVRDFAETLKLSKIRDVINVEFLLRPPSGPHKTERVRPAHHQPAFRICRGRRTHPKRTRNYSRRARPFQRNRNSDR